MRAQTPIEKAIQDELYVDRLLVVLEEDDGFRQVLLTKEMFKAVSDACVQNVTEFDADGLQDVGIALGDQLIPKEPFDGMRDFEIDEI